MRRFDDSSEPVNKLIAHDLEIDKDRYVVEKGGKEFQLPRKEFELIFLSEQKRKSVRPTSAIK